MDQKTIAAGFDSAITKLQSFASLKENWDSYDAKPLSDEVIDRAISVLIDLAKHDIPAPDVFPSPLGEISFEWRDGAIVVDIPASGKLGYLFEDSEDEDGGGIESEKLSDLLGFLGDHK